MKKMSYSLRLLMALLICVLLPCVSRPQGSKTKRPQAPKPDQSQAAKPKQSEDAGPSLEETTEFIKGKLAGKRLYFKGLSETSYDKSGFSWEYLFDYKTALLHE
jgi:hypothetical protein